MNKTEFYELIHHPENAGDRPLTEAENIISQFPYWQSIRLLYVKALQQKQHFSFDSKLKLTAIYAGDRNKLFEYIQLPLSQKTVELAESNSTKEFDAEFNYSNQHVNATDTAETINGTTDSNRITVESSLSKEQTFVNDTIESGVMESIKSIENPTSFNDNIDKDSSATLQFVESNSTPELNMEANDEPAIDISILSPEQNDDQNAEAPPTLEEEINSINSYEETAIASDIDKTNTTRVDIPPLFSEASNHNEKFSSENKTNHSFSEWLKIVKQQEVISHVEFNKQVDPPEQPQSAPANQTENEISIVNAEIKQTVTESKKEIKEPELVQDLKNELIDKFIQNEPRIQPQKGEFYSPSVAARKSVIFDEDLISETLADIFYKQKLFDKAIKAYEKLTLMFPEKSTLFAARIQKIREESQTGK